MNDVINNLPDISFIENTTVNDVLEQMISDYQDKYKELTGQEVSLALADPYRLIMYACTAQIYQAMQYADFAGKMSFLKYSYGDYLDNLAALRGISRMPATSATTILEFQIAAPLQFAVSIPAGTRAMKGNEIFFATDEYVEIAAGTTSVSVPATCTAPGTIGSGFRVGEINVLVNTLPYISSVSNIIETGGGSDIESDEALRDRVYLASSSYSVAGPEDAYVYWTKSVDAGISDVRVTSDNPCEVNVRFIMNDGDLPSEALIQKVKETLTDSNVRPLTDRVVVQAPEIEEYDINLTYYVNASDKLSAVTIQNQVNTAVEIYKEWQSGKIGRDINPSYLIGKVIEAGAKRVDVVAPLYKDISDIKVAKVRNVSVIYGGIEND